MWKVPDGTSPDFTQQFSNGATLPLAWNNYTTSDPPIDTTSTFVDLWMTSFSSDVDYSQRIDGRTMPMSSSQKIARFADDRLENIDLTIPGTFTWTINIPETTLSTTAKYVFRFKISGSTYDPDSGEVSSPGVLIIAAKQASTTTLSSKATSTASSSTSESASSTVIVDPNQHETPQPSNGLNTGAKAGVGIGITVGVLGLMSIALLFWMRRRRTTSSAQSTPSEQYASYKTYPHMGEDAIRQTSPQELRQASPHELPTTMHER